MGKGLKWHSGVGVGVSGKLAILDCGGTFVVAGITEKRKITAMNDNSTMYKIYLLTYPLVQGKSCMSFGIC